MEYRTLGRIDLRVSALGFGCGNIGGLLIRGQQAEQRRAFTRAIEAGITYFDTAPSYGDGQSEETLGAILHETHADVIVGTKVRLGEDDFADVPAAIRRSLETSLRRLGRDQVEVFHLHNRIAATDSPTKNALGVETVLGPVAEGMAAIRDDGLVGSIGVTGLGETEALHRVVAAGVFDTVQSYVNALNPSAGWPVEHPAEQDFQGLIGRAAEAGMGVIAIRVLAAGALAAADQRHPIAGDPGGPLVAGGAYDVNLERAHALAMLAAELGLESPAELSFRLVLNHAGVSTALIGFSDVEQLEAALRWAERGPLPPEAAERVLAQTGS